MLSSDLLAQLAGVREQAATTDWAERARAAVGSVQAEMCATRCSATVRNLTSLADVHEVAAAGMVVSRCATHNTFHLYAEAKARVLATTLAVNVRSLIDTAGAELAAGEAQALGSRVVRAQHAFFAAVAADRRAVDEYRRVGGGTVAVTGEVLPAQPVKRVMVPVRDHSPVQARREQAARVLAETGVTDTQLVRFYRCYRKRGYESVAAAVNATLLVHDEPQRMGVYLCTHCTYLHIGHRSQYGEVLSPAFFTRAIAKWQAEPEVAARFMASLHGGNIF